MNTSQSLNESLLCLLINLSKSSDKRDSVHNREVGTEMRLVSKVRWSRRIYTNTRVRLYDLGGEFIAPCEETAGFVP